MTVQCTIARVRRSGVLAAAVVVALCAAPTISAAQTPQTRIRISEPFRPVIGEAAAQGFRPEVAAVDSAGECNVTRMPGSTATIVSAAYPSRAAAQTRVSMTFDSAGKLVRYSETRGAPSIKNASQLSPAQVDSALRAANEAVRTTSISLDWAIDQGMLINRGGGRPTDAVLSTVRVVESLPALGPVKDRVQRARQLCGV